MYIEEVGLTEGVDRLVWVPGNGNFTSKTFTNRYVAHSRPVGSICGEWYLIWSLKISQKIKLFLWKFLSIRIPNLSLKCVWCDRFVKSVDHLFWNCELATWDLNFIGNWWCMKPLKISLAAFSVTDLFNLHTMNLKGKVWGLAIAATLWSIWLARNEALFNTKRVAKGMLEFLIMTRLEKWGKATKLMEFGNDPLWKVNPQGALALYSQSISRRY